jgi:hypothetical protein
MASGEFPVELETIERWLAARARPRLPSELRRKVLDGVESRLRRERTAARWSFAAAVAATALVWLNLSFSATQAIGFNPRVEDDGGPSVETLAAEMRCAVPELSAREAMREAFLLRVSRRMMPSVNVPSAVYGPLPAVGKELESPLGGRRNAGPGTAAGGHSAGC